MIDFPPFRLDRENQCVWRCASDGTSQKLKLTPRAFDILQYLIDHSGRLVTHDELLDALWGNLSVQPDVLKSHMLSIRVALGDDAAHPSFIETLRGRGYRFIAPLQGGAGATAPQARKRGFGTVVGRTQQLTRLQTLFEEARNGSSRIVFVAGEPGIGKTTLVNQFLDSLDDDTTVLTSLGRCIEGYGGTEPYYPVLDGLTRLSRGRAAPLITRTLVSTAPTWAHQISAALPQHYRAELQQKVVGARSDRMLREICEFLEQLSLHHPLALVFEDLHWSDYSTVDMLSALARHRSEARLMVIATYRPEDAQIAQHPLRILDRDLGLQKLCHDILLEPLTEAAIAEYLGENTYRDRRSNVPDGFARLIRERSGGNPLFMVATLDHLVERGIAQSTPDGWKLHVSPSQIRLEVPLTLSQVIEQRIQLLNAEQQRALEGASVAGLAFAAPTAAASAGLSEEEFEDICEDLCRQESFIRREPSSEVDHSLGARTYAFRHTMYRQTFYDRQGPLRRARSHLRVAEALEMRFAPNARGAVAADLAHHLAVAKRWEAALVYLRIAIQTAKKRLAYNDALSVLDRALILTANLSEPGRAAAETEFLEGRASIFAAAHDPRTIEYCEQLAKRASEYGLVDIQCRALMSLAYAYSWRDQARCNQIIDETLKLSERQTIEQQKARTLISCYVWRMWVRGWCTEDIEKCEAALPALRAGNDPFTTAWSLCEYSMVCMVSSRYQEAHDTIRANYRFLVENDENRPEFNMARATWMVHLGTPWALLYLGQFADAQREFDKAIAMFAQNGNQYAADTLTLYRCWAQFHAGDFEGMLQSCTQVIAEKSPQSGSGKTILPAEYRLCLLLTGLAHLGLGNTGEARTTLTQVLHLMNTQPVIFDWYWRLPLEWGLTGVALAECNLDDALAHANCLVDLSAGIEERTWKGLAWETRARVACERNDAQYALICVQNALEATNNYQTPLANWRIHSTAARAHHLLGDRQASQHHAALSKQIKDALVATLPSGHRLRESLATD
ncbi:Alkaline phosphatase synthesis transcriptional regulatory protein PhoP [Burkholderia sp. AD24]|nr:Alkaline phosphatase synthesis transcriptional regulatory protein PhoP [Burkholderia sp. AD24]